MSANTSGTPPPSYGIIYNWDGGTLGRSEYPQSVERWLDKTYAPIVDTQVGALFWCVGSHEAGWPSQSLEFTGDPVGRKYPNVRAMRQSENLRVKFDGGDNPYPALVERGHEIGVDVYTSIRMNDNHFRGLSPKQARGVRKGGLTQLRKDHPEWCLGDSIHAAASIAWNFAIPEVRDHKLLQITEACGQADWDGLELDWQRHGFHLPADYAYRLRYTMTDLVAEVREMTQEMADRRGRPFYLAVRVAATMESCRRMGYDVESWIEQGLCDIVICGGVSGTDPGVEVETFASMVEGTDTLFYGGFDSDGRQQTRRLIRHNQFRNGFFRATAQSYWDRGADGIYTFNWGANETTRRELLTTIGTPETLRSLNKVYCAVHRTTAGSDGRDTHDRIYGETPVTLYRTGKVPGPVFHVPVHDDVVMEASAGRLESVQLQIEMEQFSPTGDQVQIILDGETLADVEVRDVAGPDPDQPSSDKLGITDVEDNSWLVCNLRPEQAEKGMHEVAVHLIQRDERIEPPLVVAHVEIYVNYRDLTSGPVA